jgi:hypothetical protein
MQYLLSGVIASTYPIAFKYLTFTLSPTLGINEKIEGFFHGLEYAKIQYDIDEESINAKGI